MKRLISLFLAITILLTSSIVVPNKSHAQEDMDYKAYTEELRNKSGKNFNTPEAKFKVYQNGIHKSTAIPDGSGRIEDIRNLEIGFNAKVGDVIKIEDVSTPGSGTRITKRDLQIGMAHDGTRWQDGFHTYSDSTKSFEIKKPGTYVVFLNVADDYSGISNFENWSELGNWRTIDSPPIKPSGITIKGWYFTAFKIVVEDPEKPTSEFEIHHNNNNITDNQSAPALVDKYPVTVNLKDKSTVDSGNIDKWEWNVWRNNRWEPFSTLQNPNYEVVNPSVTFQLKITTVTGKTSISSHKAYFKTGSGVLDVDFDIYHDGSNKTDGSISTKNTSVTLNLQDRTSGTVNNWEWSIYNWSTKKYEVFSSSQNPSRQINLDSSYRSATGEALFSLKGKDSSGDFGQAEHSVNIQQESTVKATARIVAQDFSGQETGNVDGTFKFTAESETYDLKAYRIISGEQYITGAKTGSLTGRKDEKELTISIPVKEQISITVEVEDIKGNKAVATAGHKVDRNSPPFTFISGPNPLYPKFVTDTGEYQNKIVWTYSDIDNDPMLSTSYELYKITGNLREDGPNALTLIRSGGANFSENDSELDRMKAREITITDANFGDRYRLMVWVVDGKATNEMDYDGIYKPGEWEYTENGWIWHGNKTAYRDFEVLVPKPNFNLNIPKYQYIREELTETFDIKFESYPNKFFKDSIQYKGWNIEEINPLGENKIVRSGTGLIPDNIFLEWEVTPTGQNLKGGFYEGKQYIFRQTASFGVISGEDTEVVRSSTLYIVPVPSPDIWFREAYAIINSNVGIEGYIKQPSVINHQTYGLPDYKETFNETNSSFVIKEQSTNKVIKAGNGIITSLRLMREDGFRDSLDANIKYLIEYTATNSKGHKSNHTSDLTILQTPKPVVSIGTEDTYIDEELEVNPSEIRDNGNLSERQYIDFKDIYDSYKTTYDNTNTSWTIEELDYMFSPVKLIEKGIGIKNKIDVFSPMYEETKFYLLTQRATNSLGVEGFNTSAFAVLTAIPPTVTVNILERDLDPLTISDEIYPNESLQIKATAEDNMFRIVSTWWEIISIENTKVVKSGTGLIDGLHMMNLPVGEYKIVQYARNEKNKIGQGFTTFKIKDVLPPIVEVLDTNLVIHSSDNILYIGDKLIAKFSVYDINKSEEHPNGYELTKAYAIRDNLNTQIIREDGVADIDLLINRNSFKQGTSYKFNQFAQNIDYESLAPYLTENKSLSATVTMDFKIENIKPILELNILEGDNIPPLFTGEDIKINVLATDLDGDIKKVDYFINNINVKETPNFKLQEFTEAGLNSNEYISNFHYIGNARENINFKVVAYDDFGDSVSANKNLYITKPEITTIINIVNEENISKKENRYIEFDLNSSYTNAPIYPLSYNNAVIEYQYEGGEWTNISHIRDISNDNIRVHYPNYPNKSVISTYFKIDGQYKLRAVIPNSRGEKGDWGVVNILIDKDLPPTTDFTIISPYHRITEGYIELNKGLSVVVKEDNIGKSFFTFNDKAVSPDGDKIKSKIVKIIYDPLQNNTTLRNTLTRIQEKLDSINDSTTEIVMQTETNQILDVKNIQDFLLTYLTEINELGDYYFTYTVEEEITQLPSDTNPLHDEIKALAKSSTSEALKVTVDNIAPIIRIEVTGSETINLIIHFDTQPTSEEEKKIDEIIKELERKGIKVNVIREYGRY